MAIASVFRSRVLSGPFQLLRALSRPALTAIAVGLAAIVSGILTYLNISGFAPYDSPPATMVVLFVVDFTLVLALGVLIAWRLTRLWTERKSGAAGSRMHVRLVGMFSAIAVIPAILVAIFAAVSLNLGVEAWFSERVQTALDNSRQSRRRLCRRTQAGHPRRHFGDGRRPRSRRTAAADRSGPHRRHPRDRSENSCAAGCLCHRFRPDGPWRAPSSRRCPTAGP